MIQFEVEDLSLFLRANKFNFHLFMEAHYFNEQWFTIQKLTASHFNKYIEYHKRKISQSQFKAVAISLVHVHLKPLADPRCGDPGPLVLVIVFIKNGRRRAVYVLINPPPIYQISWSARETIAIVQV